jgi:hypothetical protein
MRASIIFTTLFAAFVAAAPAPIEASAAEIEVRQVSPLTFLNPHNSLPFSPNANTPYQTRTTRVLLADDTIDAAVQAEVPANGRAVAINGLFRLGNNVRATRAGVVSSSSGTCQIFKDAGKKQLVATIRGGADDVNFPAVALGNGVIVCV